MQFGLGLLALGDVVDDADGAHRPPLRIPLQLCLKIDVAVATVGQQDAVIEVDRDIADDQPQLLIVERLPVVGVDELEIGNGAGGEILGAAIEYPVNLL